MGDGTLTFILYLYVLVTKVELQSYVLNARPIPKLNILNVAVAAAAIAITDQTRALRNYTSAKEFSQA